MTDQLRMDVYADVQAFVAQEFPEAMGNVPGFPKWDEMVKVNEGTNKALNTLFEAVNKGDLTGTATGIVAGITALTGMAIALGIDLRPLWVAVHNARMGGGEADIGTLLAMQKPLIRPSKPAVVD